MALSPESGFLPFLLWNTDRLVSSGPHVMTLPWWWWYMVCSCDASIRRGWQVMIHPSRDFDLDYQRSFLGAMESLQRGGEILLKHGRAARSRGTFLQSGKPELWCQSASHWPRVLKWCTFEIESFCICVCVHVFHCVLYNLEVRVEASFLQVHQCVSSAIQ